MSGLNCCIGKHTALQQEVDKPASDPPLDVECKFAETRKLAPSCQSADALRATGTKQQGGVQY